MARDAAGGLVDPYGGRADIDGQRLRHVSEAFAEDPVRILRVARFAARFAPLDFEVAPETNELMRDMVAGGEVDALVPERVWQETLKVLSEPRPDSFLAVLRDCGALARIFPELDALWGVPQPERWHPEIDTGVHMLLVMRAAARLTDSPRIRYAALMHDLGKGETPPDLWPRHVGHEGRGARLVRQLSERLRVPTDFRHLAKLTARWHGLTHSFARKMDVWHIRFSQAGGVGKGDEDQVNGIRKGEVGDVRLQGDHVVIDLALESDVRLTDRSRVVIRDLGVMGDKVVYVSHGEGGRPYAPRDTLSGYYEKGIAEVMADLGNAVSSVAAITRDMQQVTASARGDGDLAVTVRNFRATSEELRKMVVENRTTLRTAIQNFSDASSATRRLTTDREAELKRTAGGAARDRGKQAVAGH